MGVSFFFVLSGFILVYTYAGREIDKRDFYQARFARIYPAYLFSPAALVAVFLLRRIENARPVLRIRGAPLRPGDRSLVLLLLQAWLPAAALSWNAVAWSLSVEAFFYAIFPSALAEIQQAVAQGFVSSDSRILGGWAGDLGRISVLPARRIGLREQQQLVGLRCSS